MPSSLEPDHLIGNGLRDQSISDLDDLRELVAYVLSLGAKPDEVIDSPNLGELALDLILRPRGSLNLEAAIEGLKIEPSKVESLMSIVGLPSSPKEVLTPKEAEAAELFASVAPTLLGDKAAIQIARVSGNAMTRIAEVLVAAFRLQMQLPHREVGTRPADIVKQYAAIAESALPLFVTTLDATLRRQIVAATERVWSTDEERSAVTMLRTIGFVDLVEFTTLTSSISVRELTDVLMEFDNWTCDVISRGHGQVVKTIGDEVMFATEEAADACRIAMELGNRHVDGLPSLRIGLATGEVLSMFGDLYGPDVNLASRLVAAAGPTQAFVSERVRRDAGHEISADFESLGLITLKGFKEPLPVYRLISI